MAVSTIERSGISGTKSRRSYTNALQTLPVPGSASYTRPADWLALPAVSPGDEKLVGLYAINNCASNFVAVICSGAYTVDWGDGAGPINFAAGVQADKNYAWTDVGSGTLSSRGYRQAIITITPQAGQHLTSINLLVLNSQTGLASGYSTGWLDIRLGAPSLTALTVGGTATPVTQRMLEQFEFVGTNSVTSFSGTLANCSELHNLVGLYTAAGTSFNTMFQACSSLQTIPLLNTAAGTNFTSMFANCSSLQTIPLLNTAAGTSFVSMFQSCPSLQTIPLLNTAAGTSFNTMFQACSSLQTIPLLNTAAGTGFNSMFANCSSLQTIPLLNTAAGTNFNTMFQTCLSLRVGALAGTPLSIDYTSCSLGGADLDAIYTNLAALNILSANAASCETNVTDWSTNVTNCAVTQSTPTAPPNGTHAARLTSTASGAMSAAITSRLAVTALAAYTFVTKVRAAVTGLSCKVSIAWYDGGGVIIGTQTDGTPVTSLTTGWTQATVTATAPSNAVTASVILSATATGSSQTQDFDTMGLFLGSQTTWNIGGAQTITVTSNWGTPSDTPSIATNKGWTVTGS